MAHTIESIKQFLATNDKAVGRALVVLTARQTEDERGAETTKHLNGRGWRPCHARVGQSMAQFFQARGFITPKQVAYWRKPMACGNPRIAIYARQLLEQAEMNAAKKADNQKKTATLDADEREALENTLHALQKDYSQALSEDMSKVREIVEQMRYVESLLGKAPVTMGNTHSKALLGNVEDEEIAMQRMEAEQDRLQTIRDETNKHRAREAMEHCG